MKQTAKRKHRRCSAVEKSNLLESYKTSGTLKKWFWCKNFKHDIPLAINLKIEVKVMSQNLFKWKHFESDIIMACVRWF